MTRVRSRVAVSGCAIALLGSLAFGQGPATLPKPDYLKYLENYYQLYAETSPLSALKNPKAEAATSPTMGLYSLRLWQATKQANFLERGQIIFGNIVSADREFDLFDSAPVALSAGILQSAGKLSAEQLNWVRQRFLNLQQKGYEFRFGNRELARLWGPAVAAFQLFPRDSAFAPTRDQFNAGWARLFAAGDLDENAGNYSSLGLVEFVGITQAMGREGDLAKSERWHQTLGRYRDTVSPGGQMPEWNDDYFQSGGWPAFLYLFEYAAHLYHDPTFETAARKIYCRQSTALATMKHGSQHTDLHNLGAVLHATELLELSPLNETAPEPMVSGVTSRRDEIGRQVPDKLILRPSNAPGSPMVWMDVYAEGDHSHTSKKGSIGYYEIDQVPVYRGGYGRQEGNLTGDGGNSFYLQPDAETFPIDTWKPNVWKTVRLKTDTMPIPGEPADLSKRVVTMLQGQGPSTDVTDLSGKPTQAERIKQLPPDSALCIANLRLEGPAGTKVVDDFSTGPAPKGGALAIVEGKPCVKVVPESKRFNTRLYNTIFDPSQYKVLAYDILQTGDLLSVNFRMPASKNGIHTYGAWNRVAPGPFYADLASATTEQSGADSLGTVTFDGYGTWDSKFVRRFVLTQEGVLVIRDTLVPGKTAAGWSAGSVWQLPEIARRGPNWFAGKLVTDVPLDPADSTPRERGQLVLFANQPGQTVGDTASTYGKKQSRSIVFSRLPSIEAGKPVTTLTVVVPTHPGVPLRAFADGVKTRFDADASEATIQLPGGKPVRVRLSDSSFSVTR
ncbi:MAG: hypothetical protein ACTHLZ_03085 [Tepidisphaeraceae bacterium]